MGENRIRAGIVIEIELRMRYPAPRQKPTRNDGENRREALRKFFSSQFLRQKRQSQR